ncbi:flagellar hook-length control protein FliK [bacterium]|nr:MAG: flagellar hook-length control protein FliK [bacterium]
MVLPIVTPPARAGARAPLGGPATPAAGAAGDDAFAALFARHWSGAAKPAATNAADSSALSQLESLLGGMLQQPPPALTAVLDRVQSALGAPPTTGTHASMDSIASRIDTLLAAGSSTAGIESTVAQTLAQAFAELSTSSGAAVERSFVARLRGAVEAVLSAPPTAARALGPPASGPPGNGPPATQATALAQRIAQTAAALVVGTDSGETGQQFRNLASTLDPSGRGLPAPQQQTAGDVSPLAASSSPALPKSAVPAVLPVLRPPSSATGLPVRIDPQLASLVSLLAFARAGDGASQPHGTPQQGRSPAATWLAAIAAVQQTGGGAGATTAATAGAAQQTPAASIDRYQVIDQVVRAMSIRPSDGTTTLRLHLVPDSLGDVSVKLVVGPNGVSASFTAATPAAGAALQQGADQLGRAFAGQGLQLQQFSVNVGADPGGGFAYRQPPSFHAPFSRRGGSMGAQDDEGVLAAIPSFGPPAAARPLGYLDYLV